jgi:hypothetical protein
MLRYIATRLLYMVPIIWLVVSVVSVSLTNREAFAGAIRLSNPARLSSSGTRSYFHWDQSRPVFCPLRTLLCPRHQPLLDGILQVKAEPAHAA